MTESEWLVASDPEPMLDFLRGKAGDRELRLFACACCRRLLAAFFDPASWCLCAVAERFVEGEADQAELDDARFNFFRQYCGPWNDVGDRNSWENLADIETRSMIGSVAYCAGGSVGQQDEDPPDRLENAREAFRTMKWVGKAQTASLFERPYLGVRRVRTPLVGRRARTTGYFNGRSSTIFDSTFFSSSSLSRK
jgi:hypothetical protein